VICLSDENEIFEDFIAYLDDNDTKKELWVKILDTENPNLVTFKLNSGKIIQIPPHRILKIKRKGVVN
jgi:uncharacterized protein (UPF0248 family)